MIKVPGDEEESLWVLCLQPDLTFPLTMDETTGL